MSTASALLDAWHKWSKFLNKGLARSLVEPLILGTNNAMPRQVRQLTTQLGWSLTTRCGTRFDSANFNVIVSIVNNTHSTLETFNDEIEHTYNYINAQKWVA